MNIDIIMKLAKVVHGEDVTIDVVEGKFDDNGSFDGTKKPALGNWRARVVRNGQSIETEAGKNGEESMQRLFNRLCERTEKRWEQLTQTLIEVRGSNDSPYLIVNRSAPRFGEPLPMIMVHLLEILLVRKPVTIANMFPNSQSETRDS